MGKQQKPLKRRLSVYEPVKTPASDVEDSQDPEEEVVLLMPFFTLYLRHFSLTEQDLLQNGVQEDDSSDSEADIEESDLDESDNEDNKSAEEQSEEDDDNVPGDSSEEG